MHTDIITRKQCSNHGRHVCRYVAENWKHPNVIPHRIRNCHSCAHRIRLWIMRKAIHQRIAWIHRTFGVRPARIISICTQHRSPHWMQHHRHHRIDTQLEVDHVNGVPHPRRNRPARNQCWKTRRHRITRMCTLHRCCRRGKTSKSARVWEMVRDPVDSNRRKTWGTTFDNKHHRCCNDCQTRIVTIHRTVCMIVGSIDHSKHHPVTWPPLWCHRYDVPHRI